MSENDQLRKGDIMEIQETIEIVSTEQETPPEQKVVEDFKLPTTKEEFEKTMKAAVNREKTNFLKELGVKSVKEYRERVSLADESLSKYQELTQANQELLTKYEDIKQEALLDNLGVKTDYREDLVKLAKSNVSETKSFEDALKELVETKYQHTVAKGTPKIGFEKTNKEKESSTISPDLQKKYNWLK